jgi:hypothetical protein
VRRRKAEAAPPKGFATSLKAFVSLDNLAVFRIDGFLREAENKFMSALYTTSVVPPYEAHMRPVLTFIKYTQTTVIKS